MCQLILTTSSTYVEKICSIIEKYHLTQYDVGTTQPNTDANTVTSFPAVPFTVKVLIGDLNYRSQPSMDGAVKGQTGKGVFTITKVTNSWGRLKSGAGWIYLGNPSYCTVQGTAAQSPKADLPYRVRVTISDLNIRKGPGTNHAKTGKCTGKGVFTITETKSGKGSKSGWGKLKSGKGWISLDYCTRI